MPSRVGGCASRRHCERSEAIQPFFVERSGSLDCFAALAMTLRSASGRTLPALGILAEERAAVNLSSRARRGGAVRSFAGAWDGLGRAGRASRVPPSERCSAPTRPDTVSVQSDRSVCLPSPLGLLPVRIRVVGQFTPSS